MINIVNLTPHAVAIGQLDEQQKLIITSTYPPSGIVARVKAEEVLAGTVNGIAAHQLQYGEIENLAESREGTMYLVSMLVGQVAATRFPNRNDLISPNTNKPFRDEKGQIAAVPGFTCYQLLSNSK